jgi:hypothetical protein
MGDLSTDGRIILKWILQKQDLRMRTGYTGYIQQGTTGVYITVNFQIPLKAGNLFTS